MYISASKEYRLWIFVIICIKKSNNGDKIAIMEKSCGQFLQTLAEDRKLKSNLEWPKLKTQLDSKEEFENSMQAICYYH